MLWKTSNVTDVVVVLKVPPLTFYPYSSTQHAPKEHNMASVATLHCIDSTQVDVGRNTAHISASHLIYTNLISPSYYYQTCSPSPSCYFPNRSPTLDSLSHLIVLEHKQASSSLYKRVYIHRGSHKWTADVCVSAARCLNWSVQLLLAAWALRGDGDGYLGSCRCLTPPVLHI